MCRATLQPKVDHIRAVATLGIHLKPLVPEIPAFGAVLVTLTKPPKLSYNIDTSAMVGKVVGQGVEQFLDGLLPQILEGFLVWPERIVVPIIADESVTGPLTDLELRHKGIMKARALLSVHACSATRRIARMWRQYVAQPLHLRCTVLDPCAHFDPDDAATSPQVRRAKQVPHCHSPVRRAGARA